jgi:hypothetical protein
MGHMSVSSATRSFEIRPLWFNADSIIHGTTNALFATEIALGCLHRNVSEQKLDLLQLAACSVTNLCA